MTQSDFLPSDDDVESLFVNNHRLDRISAYLNRFNPIRVMGMEGMEIRHSAVLAWLLDPAETHGFGDRFLKAFLAEALRGQSKIGHPTALEVAQSDLRDAQIRREWQHIDILILSRRNDWAFVVENKFHASQHDGQLAKYAARARAAFERPPKPLTVRGIFLTLHDEEPHDPDYAPLRYASICEFLPRLIELEGQSMGQEAKGFINHYLEVIRDEAGMSEELASYIEMARQIYRTHKKVLDFVMEYGADTDFIVAAETLFGSDWEFGSEFSLGKRRYMYSWHNHYKFGFLPIAWKDALGGKNYTWPGCAKWWAEYPLICWFELSEAEDGAAGSMRLLAEVGPLSNPKARRELVESIKSFDTGKPDSLVRFQKGAEAEGKKFSKYLRNNLIPIDDLHSSDNIADAMRCLLEKFEPLFGKIAASLPELVAYAEEVDE